MSAVLSSVVQDGRCIVGLTGFARSGKDSVGAVLTGSHGFRRVAFGDTLKSVAEDVNPVIEYVDRVDGRTRHGRVVDLLAVHGGREGLKDAVPEYRQLLVDLGDSLRRRIPGVEIAASFGVVGPGERVVNTNVYHPEEIDAIRAMGGVVVRVSRPGFGPANVVEAATGGHPVDVVLVNDGDEVALAASVGALLVSLGVSASVPTTAPVSGGVAGSATDVVAGGSFSCGLVGVG